MHTLPLVAQNSANEGATKCYQFQPTVIVCNEQISLRAVSTKLWSTGETFEDYGFCDANDHACIPQRASLGHRVQIVESKIKLDDSVPYPMISSDTGRCTVSANKLSVGECELEQEFSRQGFCGNQCSRQCKQGGAGISTSSSIQQTRRSHSCRKCDRVAPEATKPEADSG